MPAQLVCVTLNQFKLIQRSTQANPESQPNLIPQYKYPSTSTAVFIYSFPSASLPLCCPSSYIFMKMSRRCDSPPVHQMSSEFPALCQSPDRAASCNPVPHFLITCIIWPCCPCCPPATPVCSFSLLSEVLLAVSRPAFCLPVSL